MDPLTAGFNLATKIVDFLEKVWDATPEPLKAQSSGDIAKTLHNCSAFLQAGQEKLNAAIGAK